MLEDEEIRQAVEQSLHEGIEDCGGFHGFESSGQEIEFEWTGGEAVIADPTEEDREIKVRATVHLIKENLISVIAIPVVGNENRIKIFAYFHNKPTEDDLRRTGFSIRRSYNPQEDSDVLSRTLGVHRWYICDAE